MQVIDSDGHLHEPFDLFERHMENEFYPMRPRIVDLRDEQRDTGRWLVEGRLVPGCRLPKAWVEEASGIRRRAIPR